MFYLKNHWILQVNSGANEDMQDICIGSQEALFMEVKRGVVKNLFQFHMPSTLCGTNRKIFLCMKQSNFSYVALLKGYIDINGGYETINTQVIENLEKYVKKQYR